MSKNIEPNDFIYGKIYQVRPEFLEKFNAIHPRIYPSKDMIIREVS